MGERDVWSAARAKVGWFGGSLRTFARNPLAVLGLLIITGFALMVVAHPILMKTLWHGDANVYDPLTGYDAPILEVVVVQEVTDPQREIDLVEARLTVDITVAVGDVVEKRIQPAPPSGTHFLGTDPLGRDVFSMLLAGAWPTFVVGLSAAITTAFVGVAFASMSAVFGGRTDRALSTVSDVLLLLPAPLAMIVIGSVGGPLSPLQFGVMYGVIAGGSTAAIVLRSHALSIMQRPFIDVARVAGVGRVLLAGRHLVPNLIPLASVTMVTAVVGAVVAHGFASWLSFSDDLLNWGAMMFIAVGFIELQAETAWNVLAGGAVAISLFCAGFYLLSLGLRDIANPRDERRPAWVRQTSRERVLR